MFFCVTVSVDNYFRMFELILTVVFVVSLFYVKTFWFRIALFLVYAVLAFPGIYSMFFGAPFISTNEKRIRAIMKLGDFSSNDVVFDLGCGDGRIIRKVAKKGVKKAIGYEFSIPTYIFAKFKAFLAGNEGEIKFGNFWKKDFSEADVVICFLLERTMKDFEKKIWPTLKKGTRVISNEFRMQGIESEAEDSRVYLYVKNN